MPLQSDHLDVEIFSQHAESKVFHTQILKRSWMT